MYSTADNFSDAFQTYELIETITRKQNQQHKDTTGQFDTTSYLTSIDATISRIVELQTQVQNTVDRLQLECSEDETRFQAKLATLKKDYDMTAVDLKELDEKVSSVASNTTQIGERLEIADALKEKAKRSIKLLRYFEQLNKINLPTSDSTELMKLLSIKSTPTSKSSERFGGNLDKIFTDSSKIEELVPVLKDLKEVSAELSTTTTISQWGNAQSVIGKYADAMEMMLLDKLSTAMGKGDVSELKRLTQLLTLYNGGGSCVERFINCSQLFISEKVNEYFDKLACTHFDIPEDDLYTDTRLNEFYGFVISDIEKLYDIMKRVFPMYQNVFILYIQKIFTLKIPIFLSALLQKSITNAENENSLWLKITYNSFHTTMNNLCPRLQPFFNDISVNFTNFDISVESLCESLFFSFKEDYFTKEFDYLSNSLSKFVKNYEIFYLKETTVDIGDKISSKLKQVISTTEKATFSEKNKDIDTLSMNVDGISVEKVFEMIHTTERSVKRSLLLSKKGEIAQNVECFFKLLLNNLGDKILVPIFKSILANESNVSNVTFLLKFFHLISIANHTVNHLNQISRDIVVPNVSFSIQHQLKVQSTQEKLFSTLEDFISKGLMSSFTHIKHGLSKCLKEQKKTDFHPKLDQVGSIESTVACKTTCKYLKDVYSIVKSSMDGKNMLTFLEEVGIIFTDLLLAHLKKCKSDTNGALVVMRDVSDYRELVMYFHSQTVNIKFDTINELTKLLLMPHQNLKMSIEESSNLCKMDRSSVLEFIRIRDDYQKNWDTLIYN